MKILVLSVMYPTLRRKSTLSKTTQSLVNGVQYIINPNDEFGLTRAMWFKEKAGATVDVINVGGAETESTLRKALAIGADTAIRVNTEAIEASQVAKEIVAVVKDGDDLIIAGRESIDYNGGMVPGMIAAMIDASYVNNCVGLEIDGNQATAVREIDGGKETVTAALPLVIGGQKGLVEESDLKIPNMRGIMMARKKPLNVVEPTGAAALSSTIQFEKPAPKGEVKLVDADNVDQLIELLHNEAKVI